MSCHPCKQVSIPTAFIVWNPRPWQHKQRFLKHPSKHGLPLTDRLGSCGKTYFSTLRSRDHNQHLNWTSPGWTQCFRNCFHWPHAIHNKELHVPFGYTQVLVILQAVLNFVLISGDRGYFICFVAFPVKAFLQ